MNDIKPKNINYPPPTGRYKVKILSNCPWKGVSNIRLGISLGGSYPEEDRLFALLEWADARFDNVDILVADSIHRHNIMFERSIDESFALELAMAEGDDWIDRNEAIFSTLKSYKIHRLNELKCHSEFIKLHSDFKALFLDDSTFQTLIKQDIDSMWARRVKYNKLQPEASFDDFFEHSKNYILEELAIMDIFIAMFPGVEAYPGTFLSVLSSPERFSIKGFPKRLIDFPLIEVDFTRNKAFEQQKDFATEIGEFAHE